MWAALAAGALAVAWHAERAHPIAPDVKPARIEPDRAPSPAMPSLRRGMAIALLEGGNLRCDDVAVEEQCGEYHGEIAPPRPDATLADPCLRRHLAVWALGELEPEDTRALAGTLVEIVAMGAPRDVDDPEHAARLAAETMLPEAVFDAAIDDDLRLALLEVADPDLAARRLSDLETREARIAALVDPGFDAAARLDLLWQLLDDTGPDLAPALREVAGDPDCALAFEASRALGDLPARPESHDADEHLRALCLLGQGDDPDEAFRAWIPDRGVEVVSRDDFDPDLVERHRLHRDEHGYEPLLAESGWTCDGLTCTGGGHRGEATVTFARAGASLVVRRIEVQRYSGCGC